jgi:hypothetical protein
MNGDLDRRPALYGLTAVSFVKFDNLSVRGVRHSRRSPLPQSFRRLTQGKSPVRSQRMPGSVRGGSNGRPCRDDWSCLTF